MIFDKTFKTNRTTDAITAQSQSAAISSTSSSSSSAAGQLAITNVWSGPIIMMTCDQKEDLEKHYLNYRSTIPAESFEAIFRDSHAKKF